MTLWANGETDPAKTAAHRVLNYAPGGLSFAGDGRHLYLAEPGSPRVHVIDLADAGLAETVVAFGVSIDVVCRRWWCSRLQGRGAATHWNPPRNLLVTASDLQTLERILLRLRTLQAENPALFFHDPVPMTDPIFQRSGLGVEPESHTSFGTVRSQQIFEALQAAGPDEDVDAFQTRVRRTLSAAGVDPAAPHAGRNLQTLAPERRLWLQAGGSAMGGYHMGGLRSPAAVGNGVGAGLGGVITTVDVLRHPEQHPHPYRDIAISTGTAGLAPMRRVRSSSAWLRGWRRSNTLGSMPVSALECAAWCCRAWAEVPSRAE